MEEWRNIEGYNDYQVSNYGRIKSLKYGKERILKPHKDNHGYLHLILYKNGKGLTYKVHRLVAQAFIDNTDNLPMVNHKDENPLNNSVDNLEWCNCKYNINYGTRNKRHSEKMKKTVYQYTLDGKFIKEWESLISVYEQLGFSYGHISKCCLGKRKTAYGYIWKYSY